MHVLSDEGFQSSRTDRNRLARITQFYHSAANCFTAELPEWLSTGDSQQSPFSSPLQFFENGIALGPPHTVHEVIGKQGGGAFSHWHNVLFFSTCDNSDPRTNGREYHVYMPAQEAGAKKVAIQILESLDDNFSPDEAYASVERCLAVLYPTAKLGEDKKLFWEDSEFVRTYQRLCGDNFRSLERKHAIYNLVKSLHWLDGDLAECGSYMGATAYFMALASQQSGKSRGLHLFDSFAGLSKPLPVDGSYWHGGHFSCEEDIAARNLSEFSQVHIRKGWIPERFVEVADLKFCFVHIDVDLYEPTRNSVKFFYPRLQKGGMLVCDDHGFSSCPGVRAAMNEFFEDKDERIIELPTAQGLIIKL